MVLVKVLITICPQTAETSQGWLFAACNGSGGGDWSFIDGVLGKNKKKITFFFIKCRF